MHLGNEEVEINEGENVTNPPGMQLEDETEDDDDQDQLERKIDPDEKIEQEGETPTDDRTLVEDEIAELLHDHTSDRDEEQGEAEGMSR